MGYHRAGFDVVGVDIKPQPRYPFEFIQADAMTFPLDGFDVIHASPPCQRYSVVTPKGSRGNHHDLIALTRSKLEMFDRPWVIENVPGAKNELREATLLCGSMFGLRCQRHRLFESSPWIFNLLPPCDHSVAPLLVTTAGRNSRAIRKPGEFKSVKNAPAAYGIDWMTHAELCQAIPPAYTEYIGKQLLRVMEAR